MNFFSYLCVLNPPLQCFPLFRVHPVLLVELVHSFREMQDEIRDLREQVRNVL